MKSTSISNCATKRGTSSSGFTMTEMAIVLGVIGLILGGIWVLASQTWESMRQERLKEEVFNTVKSVRAYYQNQNGIAGTFTGLTPVLVAQRVIAGDMVRQGLPCGVAAGCADHPWGMPTAAVTAAGSFGICGWQYGAGGTTSCTVGAGAAQQYFAIELQGMPQGSCIQAVMLNSGADAPAGLYDVYIDGASMQGGGLPVKAGTAQANCVGGDTIDFIYRLVTPQS